MLHRILTSITHKITELPILVLMPHSSCNCRCVMCDIWKANQQKHELSIEDLQVHIASFKKLKVKRVALSGGEALMHTNLWSFCELLKSIDIKISLLSTGLTLKKHAQEIVQHIDDVIVSIDGSPSIHNQIRNIPNAFEKLQSGVMEIKRLDPNFRITGRCVLQKLNHHDLLNIIETSKNLHLDQISFLPADVSSEAFNRPNAWSKERVTEVSLATNEIEVLEELVAKSIAKYAKEYQDKFIAESPRKMRDIVQYYKAILGEGEFPRKKCNAPWVSAVIETDGEVKPCFFYPSYGNIRGKDIFEIVNNSDAIAFRRNLNVKTDNTCVRCVCSLHVGITQSSY
ncbi:MAG: radical SAM protein [Cyclobacteriaceae bacterium]